MKPKTKSSFRWRRHSGKGPSARLLFTIARRGWCWSSRFNEVPAAKQRNLRGFGKRSQGETDAAFVIRRTPVVESAVVGENRVVPTLRAWDLCVPKTSRSNAREAGDACQELLAVAAQVEVLVAARPGIQRDFQDALFSGSRGRGKRKTLEASHEEPPAPSRQNEGKSDLA